MARYAACIAQEALNHKTLVIKTAQETGEFGDMSIPRDSYEKCRKQEGISDSVNLYNALKKCASKKDSLDKDTALDATTCQLQLTYGSHTKFK